MPELIGLKDLDPTKKYNIGHGVTFKPVKGTSGELDHAIIGHPAEGGRCEGMISWGEPSVDDLKYNRPKWNVVQENPLTLEPSIDCTRHPEGHGYIRNGEWVSV